MKAIHGKLKSMAHLLSSLKSPVRKNHPYLQIIKPPQLAVILLCSLQGNSLIFHCFLLFHTAIFAKNIEFKMSLCALLTFITGAPQRFAWMCEWAFLVAWMRENRKKIVWMRELKRLAWTWKSIFLLRECVNLPCFSRVRVYFPFSPKFMQISPIFDNFSRFFRKISPISRKIGFAWISRKTCVNAWISKNFCVNAWILGPLGGLC